MPTYEYLREDGSRFDVMQKFSDDPLRVCPETGQKVRRLISGGSGVIYKGSGWYVTDYKKGNGSEKAEAEKKNTESAAVTQKTSSDETKTSAKS